jgi:heterotetrameric sarcosine oxidase gamma subunit
MRYAVDIAVLDPRAVIELRGDPDAASRALAAAGLPVPTRRNRAEGDVLWLGPRRWLVMAPIARETTLVASLLAAATHEPMLIAADVGDMWSGLALRGVGARDVLAQATPLDLDRLADGAATMTDIFAVPALLWRRGDSFELWCDRSLAQHIRESANVAAGVR